MEGRIQDWCKVGLVHFMLWKDCIKGEGDPSSVDVLLGDPYFDAIEVTRVNHAAARKSLAAKLKSSGKTVAFGAQPVCLTQKLDLNHPDEAERRKAVRGVLDVIPQACELGASGFGVLSGKDVAPQKRGEAKARLVDSLREIAEGLTKQGGIPLFLELFDTLPYAKNCLIGSPVDAARIAAELRKDFPSFGLMIDLSHLPLQGVSARAVWDACGPYVAHAHMGNCVMATPGHPMNGDEHPPFGDPAGRNGVPELAEYLHVLLTGGYLSRAKRPVLSFEVCVYGEWTREALIQQSKATLDAAWALI
jgi:sugar phosphate isomerase/epimerase